MFAPQSTVPLPLWAQPAAEGGAGTRCDPTGIPSGELGTSSAAPGHPPVQLVSDEPQHGQGLQGNLKLHHLCLLLQLLWGDRISLGISGLISQELQRDRLLTALVTTVWVGKQSPEKQFLVSTLPALPVCQRSHRSACSLQLLFPHVLAPNGSWVAADCSAPAQEHPWKGLVPNFAFLPFWDHLVAL